MKIDGKDISELSEDRFKEILRELIGKKVILMNSGGYDSYQGVVTGLHEEWMGWVYVDWEYPSHPCTSPIESKHLKRLQ